MHRLINFKSFAKAELNLFTPMTILIGKNGSGKSNTIEGVELLAEVAQGRPLHQIGDLGRGSPFEIRGGLQSCPRSGSKTFTLAFDGGVDFEGSTPSFEYSVGISTHPEPRISEESLKVGERNIFMTGGQGDGPAAGIIRVRYDNFLRGGKKPIISIPRDRSILSQYETVVAEELQEAQSSGGPRSTEALGVVRSIRNYLRSSFVFDPQPKLMRAYERIGNKVLGRDGANLSAVLFGLKNGSPQEQESLTRILNWIKQLPEEPYESFDFVTTQLNDVIFGLKESASSGLVDARLLSDGTLRCLAVLTAVETARDNSRVVIEEFDNGLHASRVRILTQALWDCAQRKKLNLLCTTHNPATLDGLERTQLEGVVLCFWDKATHASRLVRLLELPRADVLLERGHLGDLVTRRILEQHLLPGFEDAQRQKAQEWLDSLP